MIDAGQRVFQGGKTLGSETKETNMHRGSIRMSAEQLGRFPESLFKIGGLRVIETHCGQAACSSARCLRGIGPLLGSARLGGGR